MSAIRLGFIFSLMSLSFVSACGISSTQGTQDQNQSSIQTVSIPQTDVRNQGRLGVCWAYGTTGLIESEVLRAQKITLDISEEALAFQHMAEALRAQFATMSSSDLLNFIMRGQIPEGWVARTTPQLAAMYENSPYVQHDALALIKLYGVVPESAWSFKITSLEMKDKLAQAVRKNVRTAIANGYIIQKLSTEQIKDLILVGPSASAFPSRPPSEFKWNGRIITSRDFVTQVLKFNPDDWEAVAIQKEADIPGFIQIVKRTLALGHSVPLAFPINIDRISGDSFGVDTKNKNYSWSSYGRDGGHLVLVTDFINKGGTRGAVADSVLKTEVNKPAEELEAFLFKNSWGIGAKLNESGQPIGISPDGYYRMETGYLTGVSKIPDATKNPWAATLAVVPRFMIEGGISVPKH